MSVRVVAIDVEAERLALAKAFGARTTINAAQEDPIETLKALTVNRDGALLLRRFELRLLSILGFAPELDSCVVCRGRGLEGGSWFSPRLGGVMCVECGEGDGSARPISRDALASFRYLRRSDASGMEEKVTPEGLAGEMERTLGRYIRYQLEREVRSAGFLDRLAALPRGKG